MMYVPNESDYEEERGNTLLRGVCYGLFLAGLIYGLSVLFAII